ncbi:MAG: carbohydrate deacetylase [Chloroflexota bacterium]
MATRLIVNADDYGLTEGVSEGIRRAHLDGILTTTTAMMNMPSVMADLKLGRELCPNLGFGVHLVLTQGKPVRPPEKVPTLVRRDGRFYSVLQIIEAVEGMNPVELRDEWRAQIERFLETGIPIDHIDSHHHVVMRNEHTLRVALDLASEYGVAIRNPFIRPELESVASALLAQYGVLTTDRIELTFYDSGATRQRLLECIDNLQPDIVTELMCHPGYADAELIRISAYHRPRETELALLTDPEIKARIRERGIELVRFRDLASVNRAASESPAG